MGVGEGVVERTGKGAVYIASSRTASVGDHVYQLQFTPEMKAWILANNSHMFYFSCSLRILRPGLVGGVNQIIRVGQNGTAYALAAQEGSAVLSTSLSGLPTPNRTTDKAPGLVRVSAAGRGKDTDRNVDITSLVDWFLTGGPLSSASANKAVDFIVHDFYFEDFTVSGRNFSDVDPLFALKHAQIHGPNGRYAGDTWRDPATIA